MEAKLSILGSKLLTELRLIRLTFWPALRARYHAWRDRHLANPPIDDWGGPDGYGEPAPVDEAPPRPVVIYHHNLDLVDIAAADDPEGDGLVLLLRDDLGQEFTFGVRGILRRFPANQEGE